MAVLSAVSLLALPPLGEVGMGGQDVLAAGSAAADVAETPVLSAAVMRATLWPLSVGQGPLVLAVPAAVLPRRLSYRRTTGAAVGTPPGTPSEETPAGEHQERATP